MLITVENLEHTYMVGTPFETKVLHGVDLEVREGEMLGLVGPSQSGKSTLVQYFNGLFVPRGKGRVVVDGIDTSRKGANLKALRQKVGLVFQYPEHQLFKGTVGEDVAFGPRCLGVPPAEVGPRVDAALRAVGLEPEVFRDRYIFALSGGQKRRVAIAGVLAMNPRIMVFDDPTAGLDPRGRVEILDTIARLRREQGLTVVFVSNSLEDVARLADRVAVLAGGRVVRVGRPAEVFSDVDLLTRIGLGTLQTVDVLARLRRKGWDVRCTVLGVEEAAAEIVRVYRCRVAGQVGRASGGHRGGTL
jgi:energy-coupling factor transport system ATP-binding protein